MFKEQQMSKKIGHNYERDPYPWDSANKLASSSEWTCCDMKLPATFYICPICEKERSSEAGNLLAEDSEEV
jgi:hypothetical protein